MQHAVFYQTLQGPTTVLTAPKKKKNECMIRVAGRGITMRDFVPGVFSNRDVSMRCSDTRQMIRFVLLRIVL